jgi:hypothetical protein
VSPADAVAFETVFEMALAVFAAAFETVLAALPAVLAALLAALLALSLPPHAAAPKAKASAAVAGTNRPAVNLFSM